MSPARPDFFFLSPESQVIEIRHLSFRYKPTSEPVLKDISISFQHGESVAIIGANGSGKTSLIRCINGLHLPSEGEVSVDELRVGDPDTIHEVRARVGMVFQNPDDQIVSAQVEREIAFGLENIGVRTDEMTSRVERILDRLDLVRYRYHSPHLLSGGERQRLAIAGALVMRPRYLLMDEPTSLLDPGSRRTLLELLEELRSDEGITPIVVTQNPEEAARSDRVVVLHQGNLVLDGPPQMVFSDIPQLTRMGLAAPFTAWVAHQVNLAAPLPLYPGDLVDRLPGPVRTKISKEKSMTIPPGRCIIAASHLYHVYNQGLPGEIAALQDLNLEANLGSCMALIGPGGSGKSTFAQHLNGLLLPTSGNLNVGNLRIGPDADLRALRRQVGLIFQFPEAQLFAETVREDVAFGPKNLALDDIDSRVMMALTEVGLEPQTYLDRSPFALSGGEKRRVAIAGVLSMRPEILVMDEPTAGLDPSGALEITNLLKRLNKEGTTLILITHDMDLVAQLSHRLVALDRGRIAFNGTPFEAFREPQRLSHLSLDLPEAARLASTLRASGWPIPEEAITAPAVMRAIHGLIP
jgi:energy-coupling factor transporter ATPase